MIFSWCYLTGVSDAARHRKRVYWGDRIRFCDCKKMTLQSDVKLEWTALLGFLN